MIDAMEDTLEHEDGQDEGQYDSDAKLTHKWVNAQLVYRMTIRVCNKLLLTWKFWITF